MWRALLSPRVGSGFHCTQFLLCDCCRSCVDSLAWWKCLTWQTPRGGESDPALPNPLMAHKFVGGTTYFQINLNWSKVLHNDQRIDNSNERERRSTQRNSLQQRPSFVWLRDVWRDEAEPSVRKGMSGCLSVGSSHTHSV